jgi:DNA-binding transcriptional LysR family regulator
MKTPSALSSLGQLDLNLFYVFYVVYRERSASRAGRILGLSQSAVSHSIARLRTQVGANLFEPRGGGLVPTPVAHRMALGIEAGLGRLAASVSGSHEFDPRRDVQRVTVAMPALLEPLLLPEVVGPLRRIEPEIMVRSVRLDRAKTRRYLETGVVDAAFDTMDPADPELSSECLLEDTLCVVFSRDRVGPVDRAAYLEAQHVGVSSRSSGPTLMDILLMRQGLRRNVVVR